MSHQSKQKLGYSLLRSLVGIIDIAIVGETALLFELSLVNDLKNYVKDVL
jgi:hypothetical protein